MKVYKRILSVVLLLLLTCVFSYGCSKSKSVNLTSENYQDYLQIEVGTSNYSQTIHVNIESRNSDYIFENCEVEILPVLWGNQLDQNGKRTWNDRTFYPKETTVIKVERNGKATYTHTLSGYKETALDGKKYTAEQYSSYSVVSVKGKVSKNQLS